MPLNKTRPEGKRRRASDSHIPSRQLHGNHLDVRAQVPAAVDGRVPSRPGKAEHAEFGEHIYGARRREGGENGGNDKVRTNDCYFVFARHADRG